jgi:hypothetical protein
MFRDTYSRPTAAMLGLDLRVVCDSDVAKGLVRLRARPGYQCDRANRLQRRRARRKKGLVERDQRRCAGTWLGIGLRAEGALGRRQE